MGRLHGVGWQTLLQGHTAPVLSTVPGTQKGLSSGEGRQHVLGTAFHTSMDVFCRCRSLATALVPGSPWAWSAKCRYCFPLCPAACWGQGLTSPPEGPTSAQLVLILAPNTHRTQCCPCVWAQLEPSLLTVTEAPLSCFPACPATSWAPPSSAPGAACGLGSSSQLEPGAQWEDVGTPHFCLELLCSILSPGGTLQANSNGVKEGFPPTSLRVWAPGSHP